MAIENFKNHLFDSLIVERIERDYIGVVCNRCKIRIYQSTYNTDYHWHYLYPRKPYNDKNGLPPLMCEEYIIKNIIE